MSEFAGLTESRFAMWRAVVAVIHADGVVEPHEIHFVLENTKNLPLSAEQRQILQDDIQRSADVNTLFAAITNPKDKEDFFYFARSISWSDGVVDSREQGLIHHLRRQYPEINAKQDEKEKPPLSDLIHRLMGRFGRAHS